MNVVVTGASGLVGGAVLEAVRQQGISVRAVFRSEESASYDGRLKERALVVPTLLADTDWSSVLSGVRVVMHCAARAHIMKEIESNPLAVFRAVNVDGTLNLARQAAEAGVRRFVFVSSIKVNGECTVVGSAFKSSDLPCPEDPYAISKYEAEVGLHKIADETGMEVVVVRPPLVYGPGVKGNFSSMLRLLNRGVPLPLGSVIENRRSLVALGNLVDLLVICIDHPSAANKTFLVSDGEDLSTTELLNRLGLAMDKPARLLPVPPSLLQVAAKLLGKSDMAQRLLGNLRVDISHTCRTLGWKPPISVDEGLCRAVQGLNK